MARGGDAGGAGVAGPFDNRPGFPRRGALHLAFELGGKRFLYCYIRKNACTLMKRVILATSGGDPDADEFEFSRYRHRPLPWTASGRFEVTFFVYRDPVERMVSLFNSKFVQRNDRPDLLDNYERGTTQAADEATFADFVAACAGRGRRLDSHCRAQRDHLASIIYSHAIRLDRLAQAMRGIVGEALADAHFGTRVNATTGHRYTDPAWDVPSRELRRRFLAEASVPAVEALATPELRARIASLWHRDFAMIEAIESGAGQRRHDEEPSGTGLAPDRRPAHHRG